MAVKTGCFRPSLPCYISTAPAPRSLTSTAATALFAYIDIYVARGLAPQAALTYWFTALRSPQPGCRVGLKDFRESDFSGRY